MSLFRTKRAPEYAAVFDIGSGSICVSVVEFLDGHPPYVVYSHREPLTFIPEVSSKKLLETMLRLLRFVSVQFVKKGLPLLPHIFFQPKIHHVYCIFSAPWYVSQTKIVRTDQETPFVVTERFVGEIIKKADEQFVADMKEGKYQKLFGLDTVLLEKHIIHTKVNGYEVPVPYGKEARELELTFFTSFISQHILEAVERTLHKEFTFGKITFSSFALASWTAVRDLYPLEQQFLLMDISGEMTEVSLTHRGIVMETVSFPMGRSALIREVAEHMSVPPEVALSFALLNEAGVAEEKFAPVITSTLEGVTEEWCTAFVAALVKLQKNHPLPNKIFLTVDADLGGSFVRALRKLNSPELLVTTKAGGEGQFSIITLGIEQLASHIEYASRGVADPFTALESIFLNKLIAAK